MKDSFVLITLHLFCAVIIGFTRNQEGFSRELTTMQPSSFQALHELRSTVAGDIVTMLCTYLKSAQSYERISVLKQLCDWKTQTKCSQQ